MTETPVTLKSQQLAQALLLEQVQFFKQQLTIEHSPVFFQQFVQLFMQYADRIQLQEVAEIEQIRAVVKRYAFEMQLGAGLLEFIGEISRRIYLSAMQSSIQLQDLVSDHQFEMWLSKFLELEHIRHYINQFLKESPSIYQLCQFVATTAIESRVPKLFHPEQSTNLKFEWANKLKHYSYRQQLRIEQKLEEHLARFIQTQLADLSLLSNDDLDTLIRNIWDDSKQRPLHEFMTQITPLDVEEFFVLIYEYWKELRQSSFMQDLILYGVDIFYDFYKEQSLKEVLSGIGLEESDLQAEAVRFYPRAIDTFNKHGMLDPLLYALLTPFYHSNETLDLIQSHINH